MTYSNKYSFVCSEKSTFYGWFYGLSKQAWYTAVNYQVFNLIAKLSKYADNSNL